MLNCFKYKNVRKKTSNRSVWHFR